MPNWLDRYRSVVLTTPVSETHTQPQSHHSRPPLYRLGVEREVTFADVDAPFLDSVHLDDRRTDRASVKLEGIGESRCLRTRFAQAWTGPRFEEFARRSERGSPVRLSARLMPDAIGAHHLRDAAMPKRGTMKGTTMPGLSRREFLAGASALGGVAIASAALPAQITTMAPFERLPPYGNNTLPAGVTPRLVPNVNGLTVNMIEAGTQGHPLVLLLHGFPNLGYSWRKAMPALADAGYYVIAPDCRGFGRTVGWDKSWDADPTPFLTLNMVRDQIALVYALGYRKAEIIVGHDQGQLIATYAAIVRPDMFLRLTTVSSAGGEPPSFPFAGTERKPAYTAAELDAEFAKLNPPRRDYQDYWASKRPTKT